MRVMKVFLPALMGLLLVSAAEAQTAVRIGYIDSQAILDQDPSAQAAQQQFEASMATYQAEVRQMGEDLQRLRIILSDYDPQRTATSAPPWCLEA
jgi:Skp family chaperone for outer membrane proteins